MRRISNDGMADLNPFVSYDDASVPNLIWAKGDKLMMSRFPFTEEKMIREGLSQEKLGFTATNDSAGNIAILWGARNARTSELYLSTYDVRNNSWGEDHTITAGPQVKRQPFLTMDNQGNVLCAFADTELVGQDRIMDDRSTLRISVPGRTDLSFLRRNLLPI